MENKFPKNVRQIGNVSDTPKIYVEDYVDTFLNQICDKADKEPVSYTHLDVYKRQSQYSEIQPISTYHVEYEPRLIVRGTTSYAKTKKGKN